MIATDGQRSRARHDRGLPLRHKANRAGSAARCAIAVPESVAFVQLGSLDPEGWGPGRLRGTDRETAGAFHFW